MKQLFLLLITLTSLWAIEIEMRDGTLYRGDVIHQTKGKIVIKSGTSRLSCYKKSIKRIDTTEVLGKRKFMIADSLILKEKHDIFYTNYTSDSVTVKLRDGETGKTLFQKSGAPSDTINFPVIDGVYSETVKYWNDTVTYYSKGQPYEIKSKPDTFIRQEIELRGYPDGKAPTLKSLERAYDKE